MRWPIEQKQREILEAERGTIRKDPGVGLNLALIYPNTYQVGMANLGLQVVYGLINARADALCERVFLPDSALAAVYAKSGEPLLTLESSRPLTEFDLILATLPFENDAPNLAAMLSQAGLEPLAERRGEDAPPVILGGIVPMLNPEPLAPLVDGFLLGEAEVVLGPFLEAVLQHQGRPRAEWLLHLARTVPGFYAPGLYEPQYRADGTLALMRPAPGVPERIVAPKYHGPASGLAQSLVTAPGPEFGQMHLMEVGRGCGHACRFCAAGHLYRPPRLGAAGDFAADALAQAASGQKIGLVSAAVTDLPGLDELARDLVAAGGQFSLSSLRADRLTPELAAALAACRHQTVALAPEAGSARLRRVINKGIEEADIFRAVEMLITAGVPNIKLYFMLGLPTETAEDLEDMVRLIREVRAQVVSLSRASGHLGLVTAGVSCFVPKPWTPFQWEPMAQPKDLQKKIAVLEKACRGLANLKITHELPKYARLQAVITRGDRRVAPLILDLAAGGKVDRSYRESGVDPDFYAHRRREPDEALPWELVDHGLSRDYLWAQRQKALAEKTTPDCRPESCRACGVCKDQ